MEQTGFPPSMTPVSPDRVQKLCATMDLFQESVLISWDVGKESWRWQELLEDGTSMGLKRQTSFSARLVRVMLVPSISLVIAFSFWIVLVIAPLSLPCEGSCYTFLEFFATNRALQADRAAVRVAGNPLSRDGQMNTRDRTPNEEGDARDSKLQARSPSEPSEEVVLASVMADIVEKLRVSGAPLSTVKKNSRGPESCDGRYVYVYDLPSKFNADLLGNCSTILSWYNLCDFLSNSGMGKVRYDEALLPAGRWFETHQYSLEVLFHAKLLHHRCLTSDPASASLFYIPVYAGLDVLRWNFASNTTTQQLDQLSLDLVQWLETQPWWHRNGGRDHVLVLGKITWDFRRVDNKPKPYGSSLLNLPQMQNLTKLLIERQPWDVNDIGVPHPTFFHPSSDDDIRLWQQYALNSPRNSFISFAGMPRPGDPNSIRSRLIQQCEERRNVSLCRVLRCQKRLCLKPESTMKLFLNSHFCLQPGGDSPTRRSIFDSLIAGCIPVLFDPASAYAQYPWHLPKDSDSWSVYIPQEDVRKGFVNVVSTLQQVPQSKLEQMRKTILFEILPHLLYAQPGAKLSVFEDAFDVSLQSMINRAYTRSSN